MSARSRRNTALSGNMYSYGVKAHCIKDGVAIEDEEKKTLFDSSGRKKVVNNINAYLMNADNFFITNRTTPLCDVPRLISGNKPVDGDYLKINEEDYTDFIEREPDAKKYIKNLVGGYEFINNKKRYVLWLAEKPTTFRDI